MSFVFFSSLSTFIFCFTRISSWEKVTLKDNDALQTIYHSPLLTALTAFDYFQIDYQNATGYLLQINTGLMDICTHLRRPNHLTYEPTRCKQTIARPAIGEIFLMNQANLNSVLVGLAIIGVIFVVVGIVCTGFADEESQDDRAIELLSYGSAISTGLGGLLLFTSHWTYSLSSELQLPTLYVKYGYSTYLVVTSAVLSLLSMSLVLWRTVSINAHELMKKKNIFE